MKFAISLVFVLVLSGCQAVSHQAQLETALSLTKEHFRNTATVSDDSLDVTAKITTYSGFREKRGLLRVVWNDNFLRAFVDKKTGRTTYQVYQFIRYQGGGWNFFHAANYETATSPRAVEVTVIDRDVNCRSSRYSGCTYTETVGFDVDESLLRTIAGRYTPGQRLAWKFKFRAKSGQEHNTGMLPAEVAGLLEKVDEYRALRGLN